jgi:hypothetical protein
MRLVMGGRDGVRVGGGAAMVQESNRRSLTLGNADREKTRE